MTQVTITVDPTDPEGLAVALMTLEAIANNVGAPVDVEETPKSTKKTAAAKKAAAKAEAEAAAVAEAEAEPESEYSLDDVRKALKSYATLESKEAAVQILHDHDAESVSALDVTKYAEVIAACGE
jgi:hypothetical protein